MAFSLLLLAVSTLTLSRVPLEAWEHAFTLIGRPTQMASELETLFSSHLFGRTTLRGINLRLLTLSGQREFGNLFLTTNGLIPRFDPSEDVSIHQRNTRAVVGFVEGLGIPAAAVLLPTPTAILQDQLPPYAAELQFSQHRFIENTYKAFAGKLATVDVYPALFASRDDYLYYRTDGGLTTHGGYIVYRNIANRLGLTPASEQSFRIQFLPELYYGGLYHSWGQGGVKGDTVALYHSSSPSLFTVHHWRRYEDKTYYSLYPLQAAVGGNPQGALLGGRSPIITITNHLLPNTHGSLLVLGDSNMMGVLPFLALHYRTVTFADPDMLTDSELAGLDSSGYSQILFGFSLERYMNSVQPARATTVGSEAQ